ncbi:GntR family transcriptional regulator [Acidisoma cellulosilytica]|uniref:GntR family transcriptional regulator n=1 Tax=Acidisoma cellulosilyticum TaxID=2802395 RepID=A0A964E3Q7_9PROT|nr:GntR family transcriptional regulator [Acidisoma cellulosilyticum]MCB8880905.1 GntR family transcriptional regulator [Acidisoma cellulosilyticum]
MTPIKRPSSLADVVLDHLRYDIVSGQFRLGELLSERVLAERFGVSKSPVREALAQLRLEGLVRIVPQRGAFVFTLSSAGVRQLCEFRRTLESTSFCLAFARDPVLLASTLRDCVAEMEQARAAGEERRYLDLDSAYHKAIFDLCGNSYIAEAYALNAGKIAALRTHLSAKPCHTDKSFAEHGQMAAAVAAGDLAAALAILDLHIGRSETTYEAGVADIGRADGVRPVRAGPVAALPKPARRRRPESVI